MKLLAYMSACIQAILDSGTRFITKSIPSAGESIYNSLEMVNDTVSKAREELLLENKRELAEMRAKYDYDKDTLAEIKARMNSYHAPITFKAPSVQ